MNLRVAWRFWWDGRSVQPERTSPGYHAARYAFSGWAAAALIVGLSSPAWAAFEYNDETWEGASQLLELARQTVGRERVALVATLDFAVLTPADGVLVLHPEVRLDYQSISGFLRSGGRLALLDDYGTGAELLSRFQIHRIRAPLRPVQTLRDNPNLAIAVPAVQRVAGYEQGRHPIVADVNQLVTNHPTGLTHPNLTPILTIIASDEPETTLAVTGIIAGRGRLLAMTDPSAVINLMMRYPGNRAFAKGLCEYLLEDDTWGTRGGKLYLLANDFRQSGQFGEQSSLLRDVLEQVEEALEALAETREKGLPERLALGLAVLAALAAGIWAVLAAARTYRRAMPRYAAPTPLVAQGGAAGRVAVLAAPTTPRALALLELKSALEEQLRERLRLAPGISTGLLLAEIDRQAVLSRRSSEELKLMFAQVAQVESKVAASQTPRVSVATVERLRRLAFRVLSEFDAANGGSA